MQSSRSVHETVSKSGRCPRKVSQSQWWLCDEEEYALKARTGCAIDDTHWLPAGLDTIIALEILDAEVYDALSSIHL